MGCPCAERLVYILEVRWQTEDLCIELRQNSFRAPQSFWLKIRCFAVMQCAACSHPEAPPVFQWLPGCQACLHNPCCSDFAVWLKERDALQQLLRAWRVLIFRLRRRARNARRDIVLRLAWRWKVQALLEEPTLRFAEQAFTCWWVLSGSDVPGLVASDGD